MLESRVNKLRQPAKPSRRKARPFEHGGERRIVTALCFDLVGSTRLLQLLDIEDYQELIAAFQNAAKQSITSHSGVMLLEAGDGGVALFPNDLGAKDAASLAIRAGLGIVEGCARVGREALRDDLHVRVGIATSVALVQETQDEPVAAAALAIATRLQEIAAPDAVFVSEETRDLAGRSHAFVFEGDKVLKGFAVPEKVWRALGHKIEVNRFYAFGRLGGPFIGRERELSAIAACWERIPAKGGEMILLEGDAGIGKSRLLREARKITRDQRSGLFFFQCLPGGHRATLHPLLNTFTGAASGPADQPTSRVCRLRLWLPLSNETAFAKRKRLIHLRICSVPWDEINSSPMSIPKPFGKKRVAPCFVCSQRCARMAPSSWRSKTSTGSILARRICW
ncbi:putative adenylate/guanylate cyclase [Rhizobium sp. PDO1-076]|nr:putative adenylate/guanylate cyclase [Rhizobium sp. PDO1-076]